MSRRMYGFEIDKRYNVTLHEEESQAVKLIFSEYLNGLSLGRICERLEACGFISPGRTPKWSRSSVDNILTKGYYISSIISFEDFAAVQFQREARSNRIEETGKRKTTRYHSKNELSGLFVCGECGASYRRITKHSGEVVWRCANRVEHGKEICKTAPTITEIAMCQYLTEMGIDSSVMKEIQSITVSQDKQFTVHYPELELECCL